MKNPKYPAYGRQLADRLRWKNPPKLIFIELGGNDAWKRAKKWQCYPDFASLVVITPDVEPKRLKWPVFGCHCLIEWEQAAPEPLIVELVKCLRRAGALNIGVQPMWVDHTEPSHYFDTATQIFIQIRECLKIYTPRKEMKNVA